MQSPALGAAVAALGLSNKAVYAEDMQDSNGGMASGMEGGNYTEGPDMAPNAAPAAVAGWPSRLCLVCQQCLLHKHSCAAVCITTVGHRSIPKAQASQVSSMLCVVHSMWHAGENFHCTCTAAQHVTQTRVHTLQCMCQCLLYCFDAVSFATHSL